MSPLKRKRPKTKRAAEWSVRGSGDGFGNKYTKVKVENGRVTVNWLQHCAEGTRSFTPHDLRELIMYIDGPATRYPEMWLGVRDSDGVEFYVHLEDGKITANVAAEALGFVSWAELEAAFHEALEELVPQE